MVRTDTVGPPDLSPEQEVAVWMRPRIKAAKERGEGAAKASILINEEFKVGFGERFEVREDLWIDEGFNEWYITLGYPGECDHTVSYDISTDD